mgnify:CR=1 FL=1
MKTIILMLGFMMLAGQAQANQRRSAELLILCERVDFSATNKALCGYAKALKDHVDQRNRDPLNDVPAYQDIMVPRDVACLYPSVRPTTFCDGLNLPPLPYKQAIPWPQNVRPILTTVKGKLIKPFIRASNLNIPDDKDFSVEEVCSLITDFAPHDRILCAPSGKIALIDRAVTSPWKITHDVDFALSQAQVTSFEQQQLYRKVFSDLESYRQKLIADGFDIRNGRFEVTKAIIKGNADPSGAANRNLILSMQRADNVTEAILQVTSQLGVHCPRTVIEVARGENYDYGSCLDETRQVCQGIETYRGGQRWCQGRWIEKKVYDQECLALARKAGVELTVKFNERNEFHVDVRLN